MCPPKVEAPARLMPPGKKPGGGAQAPTHSRILRTEEEHRSPASGSILDTEKAGACDTVLPPSSE